jgi:hypothetical protein
MSPIAPARRAVGSNTSVSANAIFTNISSTVAPANADSLSFYSKRYVPIFGPGNTTKAMLDQATCFF